MNKEYLKEFFKNCYRKECNDEQFKVFCNLLNEFNEIDKSIVIDYCSQKGTIEERLKIVAKKYKVNSEIIKETISNKGSNFLYDTTGLSGGFIANYEEESIFTDAEKA